MIFNNWYHRVFSYITYFQASFSQAALLVLWKKTMNFGLSKWRLT